MNSEVLKVTEWLIEHLEDKLGVKVLPILEMITDNVVNFIGVKPKMGGVYFNVAYNNEINTWGLTVCLDEKTQSKFADAVINNKDIDPNEFKTRIAKLKGTDYMMIFLESQTTLKETNNHETN